jgi:CheY-like chemotaxis protein
MTREPVWERSDELPKLLRQRLNETSSRSRALADQSGVALNRLHHAAATSTAVDASRSEPQDRDSKTTRSEPSADPSDARQMQRRHVLIVNHEPAFLDAVRVMLQDNAYNVTTTNLVPSTYQMIEAVNVDVLVLDVSIDQRQILELVGQIVEGKKTRTLPLVFTSSDPNALDEAGTYRGAAGRTFIFLKPFNVQDLLDAVHALVGAA